MSRNVVQNSKPRNPAVAGMFYPGSPKTLRREIEKNLEKVNLEKYEGELIGLISPHAGYVYSGPVAAYGFKLLEKKSYDIVVVLAPSHRVGFHGGSIYSLGPYVTPLGEISLAEDVIEDLLKLDYISTYPEVHREEHSLEVQLPFLQVVMPDFKLVPIVIGDFSARECEELAGELKRVLSGKNALVIASTDLSHFHSYKEAVRLDSIVVDHVKKLEIDKLAEDFAGRVCEACGSKPILTLMNYARLLGAKEGTIFKYLNSGDTAGESSRGVVGYLSAGFFVSGAAVKEGDDSHSKSTSDKVGVDMGLSEEEKKILRDIASNTIAARFGIEPKKDIPALPEKLKEKRGAFVTLHKNGDLRGCIGYIEPILPLSETIEDMALSAAFKDPRFPPLSKQEFDDIDLEISVLTPLRKISDVSEIQVGVHGIYMVRGMRRGLLLPQVATERNWDRETFLDNTCLKAGLSPKAWKDKATDIYIFSADIF